jgi:hypothetical protein
LTTKDYSVLLEGVDALDLPLGVLRDLCDLFVVGAPRGARLVAEGRSVARGTPPAWAVAAADIHVSKFERGSLRLGLTAKRLVDAAPDAFAQTSLFLPPADSDATALDLFLDAADDAAAGRRDSDRLDAGVLEVLARTGGLFTTSAMRLSVLRAGRSDVTLDQAALATIRKLTDETPPGRVARVRGVLDTLTMSTRAMVLRLESGRTLRGFAGAVPVEQLKQLLGADVVVEGVVAFRPSGDAIRLEAESVSPAKIGDSIWSSMPVAEPLTSRPRLPRSETGLDAWFGAWPGDETDAQLSEALQSTS